MTQSMKSMAKAVLIVAVSDLSTFTRSFCLSVGQVLH